MGRIISASIDVSKIDKSKLIEGKNGAKYYNFVIAVNDQPNEYGKDVLLSQSQTKEDREAKVKKTFVGSGKTVWMSEQPSAPTQKPAQASDEPTDNFPF
jgi:hypothetical protein